MELVVDDDYKVVLQDVLFNKYEEKFFSAPAAMFHHQNYVGGLAEHSVQVAEKALSLAHACGDVNKDLIIAGALLHDIGKMYTYKNAGGAIDTTDEGKLLDHIVLGLLLVNATVTAYLPAKKLMLLQHIILSHHGKYEWGSPVLPMCREAIIVHEADMMDATMSKIHTLVDETPEEKNWTKRDSYTSRSYITDVDIFMVDDSQLYASTADGGVL
jgi:3'-5' exoribonuclease